MAPSLPWVSRVVTVAVSTSTNHSAYLIPINNIYILQTPYTLVELIQNVSTNMRMGYGDDSRAGADLFERDTGLIIMASYVSAMYEAQQLPEPGSDAANALKVLGGGGGGGGGERGRGGGGDGFIQDLTADEQEAKMPSKHQP